MGWQGLCVEATDRYYRVREAWYSPQVSRKFLWVGGRKQIGKGMLLNTRSFGRSLGEKNGGSNL